jgi:DNA-binding transcriptional regulator YdaS (Cro superfamily)
VCLVRSQLAKAEVRKLGISELAGRLAVNPSNLAKAIKGERPLSASIRKALQNYFREMNAEIITLNVKPNPTA